MSQPIEVTTRAGRAWAYVPAGILLCMFLGLGTLAHIAIDDPSFSLEPDYYVKAVHWDQSQAQLRENETLGFTLTVRQPLQVASRGVTPLELELKDRAGVGISGANLEIVAFPNAFANRVERPVLHEVAPGIYRGELKHALPGLWELRCNVSAGQARYSRVIRTDVVKRSAA